MFLQHPNPLLWAGFRHMVEGDSVVLDFFEHIWVPLQKSREQFKSEIVFSGLWIWISCAQASGLLLTTLRRKRKSFLRDFLLRKSQDLGNRYPKPTSSIAAVFSWVEMGIRQEGHTEHQSDYMISLKLLCHNLHMPQPLPDEMGAVSWACFLFPKQNSESKCF